MSFPNDDCKPAMTLTESFVFQFFCNAIFTKIVENIGFVKETFIMRIKEVDIWFSRIKGQESFDFEGN